MGFVTSSNVPPVIKKVDRRNGYVKTLFPRVEST